MSLLAGVLLAAAGCNKKAEPDRNASLPGVQGGHGGQPDRGENPTAKPEEAAVRDLIEHARPLVDECRRLGRPEGRVSLLGKALILDLETGTRREANDYLPEELRGNPTDPELTLFLIVEKHRTLVATYTETNAKNDTRITGYRVDVDLAVIRWPSKKPVGMVRVKGDNPPEFISVRQFMTGASTLPTAVTGWFDLSLSRWVAGLPAAGNPDPVADALALIARAKGKEDVIIVRCSPDDKFAYAKGASAPKRKGKVLIWDAARDRPAGKANKYLPEELRGKLTDAELTLLAVTPPVVAGKPISADGTLVAGTGSINGIIVYWPEKKVAGTFKLVCDGLIGYADQGHFQADEEGQVAVDPERGLYDTTALKLSRWVKSLAGP